MCPYGPFLCLPRWLFLLIAGPEETKNLAGQEILCLIQNRLATHGVWLKLCQLVKLIRRKQRFADSSSRNAVSSSSARTMKRFPSSRCASALQIVRPSQSKAETQPQLHPALLRLSAMISHYFIFPGESAPADLVPPHSPQQLFWQPTWLSSRLQVVRDVLARDSVFSSLSWPLASSLR